MALISMAVYATAQNNKTDLARRTFDSLLETVDLTRHRVIIVDNGSCPAAQAMFHDYNKTLLSSRVARCTPKALETQHAQVLQNLDAIKDTVNHHYATLN